MSSIFSPFFRGQKTSFFCCFLTPKSAPNHYILWSISTFSHPNHYASSELSLLRVSYAETYPPFLCNLYVYLCIDLIFKAILYPFFTYVCINIMSSFLSLQGFVEGITLYQSLLNTSIYRL